MSGEQEVILLTGEGIEPVDFLRPQSGIRGLENYRHVVETGVIHKPGEEILAESSGSYAGMTVYP